MKEITRSSYHFISQNFYKNRIKTIFLGYDLCPNIALPQIVSQIETAFTKCLEYAKNKKSSGLHLMGHSAGAHLVASLFPKFVKNLPKSDQNVIKNAILVSGVFDLVPITKTEINQPLKLDQKSAFELSPLNQNFEKIETKFLVIVGEFESPEFIKQSREFSKTLDSFGVAYEFFLTPGVDHFDIIECLSEKKNCEKIVTVIKN